MAEHQFNESDFRALFPQFASEATFAPCALERYWDLAVCYLGAYDTCGLSGPCRQTALYLMAAHLAIVFGEIATGGGSVGLVTSSTVDRVSVTVQLPSGNSALASFLNRSPYGLQLRMMLRSRGSGGWMVGGSIERMGMRKAGGRF